MSTKWRWLTDETWYWKGHVVSDDLVHDIEMELHDRAVADGNDTCTFLIVDQTDEAHYDLPGMMMTTRKLRALDVEGLQLRIPSMDFEDILSTVRLLQERKLPDGRPYYKLHGWRFCIVLTPAERQALIAAMEAQLADVEAEAEDDRRRFTEGLAGSGMVSLRALKYEQAAKGNKGAN